MNRGVLVYRGYLNGYFDGARKGKAKIPKRKSGISIYRNIDCEYNLNRYMYHYI